MKKGRLLQLLEFFNEILSEKNQTVLLYFVRIYSTLGIGFSDNNATFEEEFSLAFILVFLFQRVVQVALKESQIRIVAMYSVGCSHNCVVIIPLEVSYLNYRETVQSFEEAKHPLLILH